LFTDNATATGELKLKGLFVEGQRSGRTYRRTKTTVDAGLFIDGNLLPQLGYLNILLPHPVQRGFDLVNISRELHYQFSDFVRSYLSPENIAGDIEIFS
jgi:hypothetical protein